MKKVGLSIAGVILLSACQQANIEQGPIEETVKDQLVDGINISQPRMVLAPVVGNPAAIYFDLTYVGEGPIRLEDAAVEGAQSTMIHATESSDLGTRMSKAGPLELLPSETIEFKPGGLHVMAMSVSADIEAGQTTQVTLTLSNGTTASFQAEVRGAGEER